MVRDVRPGRDEGASSAAPAPAGSGLALACQIPDRDTGLMAGRQQLDQAVGTDEPAAAGHQNTRHLGTRRLDDAGLARAGVEDAIERIMRAVVAVGDRYAVLLSDRERVRAVLPQFAAPVNEVLARGIESGVLRTDLSIETLSEFLNGAALSAFKLTRQRRLGLEKASAAAASLFLNGSRLQGVC
jgi:hypothetical protein